MSNSPFSDDGLGDEDALDESVQQAWNRFVASGPENRDRGFRSSASSAKGKPPARRVRNSSSGQVPSSSGIESPARLSQEANSSNIEDRGNSE